MTRDQWLAEFARRLGTEPPTPQEVERLLALAADAAHDSERTAAPIACWLAGRDGRPVSELAEIARTVAPAEGPPA